MLTMKSLSRHSMIFGFLRLSPLKASVDTSSILESHYTRGDLASRPNHRRMGTLWLAWGAEGLIAQNFTQITGADTGFPEGGDFTSTPPPWTLSVWRHSPSGKLKNTPPLGHSQAPPPPWTLSAWRHPPSGKLKNTPLPPLLLPKKRTAAAQKTELPKS